VARRLLETTDRAFRIVVSDGWIADLLRTKVLARIAAFAMGRARIPRTSYYLVRPDGYVGLAGASLQAGAVERYLSGRLGPGS
jgi:hypothetical protein